MGYDGIPLIRIKGNKYLVGTKVQYLQQHGNLVIVQDKEDSSNQTPLSQFLAENIVKEMKQLDNLMQFHDKSFVQTVELLVQGHKAPKDVVAGVARQISEDRYHEL